MTQLVALARSMFLAAALLVNPAMADIAPFVGSYSGSAKMESADGSSQMRDMSVTIDETKDGFEVEWTSVSYRDDGRTKSKTYKIEFIPSGRGDVFAAAMQRNVFGHAVQLDPMKGEPYVWARLEGPTLSVFSLYVREDGGYFIQQYDRTLAEGGLELYFRRFANGDKEREVRTFLTRN